MFLWFPPHPTHSAAFSGSMINKAVTLFIWISQSPKSPHPSCPVFWPFTLSPLCLAFLSHIISVSSPHWYALKRRWNQFPMRLSGSLTDTLPLPNFISSAPPCPQIFHLFPLIHPPPNTHRWLNAHLPCSHNLSVNLRCAQTHTHMHSHTPTHNWSLYALHGTHTHTVTAMKD